MSERCGMVLEKSVQTKVKGVAAVTLVFAARIDAALMNGLPREACEMYARMLEADLTGQWAPSGEIAVPRFAVYEPSAAAETEPDLELDGGCELHGVRLKREDEKGERVTRLSFGVRLTGDAAREAAKWAARYGCKGVELEMKEKA